MKIRLIKCTYFFQNIREFLIIYTDIFLIREYKFRSDEDSPLIIDCGSHIGLSVLYFKLLYPKSRVLAFEPNPKTFEMLKKNVKANKLQNVELINKAVFDRKGRMNFYADKNENHPWSWGDSLMKNAWYNPEKARTLSVETVELSKYITSEVDFIKMDIEGAETVVIKEVEKKLLFVKRMKIEFHGSRSNKINNLGEIIAVLNRAGFVYRIKEFTWFNVFWRYTKASEIKGNKDPYYLIIDAYKK